MDGIGNTVFCSHSIYGVRAILGGPNYEENVFKHLITYANSNFLFLPADAGGTAGDREGRFGTTIGETAAPVKKYEAPNEVKDSVIKNNVTVNFDAAVIVPDVEKYPVYKAEYTGFTQEQATKTGELLFEGRTLFKYSEDYNLRTKEEIQNEILYAQRGIQEAKEMSDRNFNIVNDGKSREEVYAEKEKYIEELEK